MLKVYSIPQLGYVTKDDNSIIFNTPSKEYNWYLNIRKRNIRFHHYIAFMISLLMILGNKRFLNIRKYHHIP